VALFCILTTGVHFTNNNCARQFTNFLKTAQCKRCSFCKAAEMSAIASYPPPAPMCFSGHAGDLPYEACEEYCTSENQIELCKLCKVNNPRWWKLSLAWFTVLWAPSGSARNVHSVLHLASLAFLAMRSWRDAPASVMLSNAIFSVLCVSVEDAISAMVTAQVPASLFLQETTLVPASL